MGFLRSVFISAFVAYLLAAFGYALVQLIRGMEPALSWLGMMVSALGPLSFFAWVFIAAPARTERHPVGFSVVGGLGLAITMAMSFRYGPAAGIVHAWAGLALVGWAIYLLWYSPFRNRHANALAPGARLPPFELENTEGESVPSTRFAGRPTIWLFYRGNWCPICTAQIGELAQQYRNIEEAGAAVVLVSPQDLSKQQALASRFDVPMNFLRDSDNRAAARLGILDRWGTPMGMQVLGYDSDTVMPTVIITDDSGTIMYSHLTDNYRIRPEPDQFIKALSGNA